MSVINVAAGVLVHPETASIFICKRLDGTPYEGFWEYPGGKIEPGETPEQALGRELEEEIGVRIGATEPLITVRYDYPDRSVRLHVYMIREFHGEPWGREGQETAWRPTSELKEVRFLSGNRPITAAAMLPRLHAITDLGRYGRTAMLETIAGFAQPHVLQVRDKHLNTEEYTRWAVQVVEAAGVSGSLVMLNRPSTEGIALLEQIGAHGLHLDSWWLGQMKQRPIGTDYWLSVACHNAAELEMAARINADFSLLSPILPTTSHPSAESLGWDEFSQLCGTANLPVFALGGLKPEDAVDAWNAGAQGIAGISGFWRRQASDSAGAAPRPESSARTDPGH